MKIESEYRSRPIYLLPKVDLSDPKSAEMLQRLNLYAGVYRSLQSNPSNKVWVAVTNSNRCRDQIEEYSNLDINILGTSLISFFLRILWKCPRAESKFRTIIAGDPVFGFLAALLIKITSIPLSNIQLQFHGDIYSASTIQDGKTLIRFLITRLSLKFAQSIRVVSNFQIEELRPITRKNVDFRVAPIPLNYLKIPINSQGERIGIGFIGRLHYERGLNQFVEIVLELRRRYINEPIYVIGDGPEKDYLTGKLQTNSLGGNIFFLGSIKPEELSFQYATLRVVLSCAPNEGYGLTLREAALSGIYVVAHRSNGAIEAKADFDAQIQLYESIHEAADLIIDALNTSGGSTPNEENIETQKAREMRLISNWVSSW